ncbi:MAG: rhomboid family intramembrane serine protease [Planctomycetes bacterium]|nr:rhomboid family intramembrane serine protease [Planctomycetota bacterium]MCP4772452.1 rhomboid family intramembrane serine protease [Planctomycetota bacterium]MCP4860155.1 rhomboid family intramembrane serine protease [Planctomycetota bacterium]
MMQLTPLVKRILIAWAAIWAIGFLTGINSPGLATWLALDPRALMNVELTSIPGLLTYTVVHSPSSIFHLLFNAWMFALFAPEIEVLFPGKRFMLLLLKAALWGTGFTLLLYGLFPSTFSNPVIGGSGLVSAVIAASAAVYPDRVLSLIILRVRLLYFFLFIIALDFLFFLGTILGAKDGIAHHVHLAGALCGWLAVGGFQRIDGPWRRWAQKSASRKAEKDHQQQQNDEAELDRILAKISKDGLPSLTAAERSFLERRSKR